MTTVAGVGGLTAEGSAIGSVLQRISLRSFKCPRSAVTATPMVAVYVNVPWNELPALNGGSVRSFEICWFPAMLNEPDETSKPLVFVR